MKAATRILLTDDNGEKFFGEGPYRLLMLVEETCSLRQAAQRMDMSYSKAIRILNRAEQELGFALTERTIGGASGGGSRLTVRGKEWCERYAAYRDACVAANRRLYLEFFPEQRSEAPASDR